METIEIANFLTVQEAANELGVTDAAIRSAILKNRLGSVTMFGRKLISRGDLAAYKARTRPDGVKTVGRPRRKTISTPNLSAFTTLGAEVGLREIWDTPEENEAWRDL
jgi:excisionase family DNA binding protein